MENVPFWALVAAYAAHILEEYALDWQAWTMRVSGMAMGRTQFFVANAAVIVLGISCSAVGWQAPYFSFLFVGLAVTNALFAHVGATIVKWVFSPGLITSVTLFLPLGIWAYVMAAQKGVLTIGLLIFSLTGGVLIMLFPIFLQFLRVKYIRNDNTRTNDIEDKF